jgi:hypothetical protein
MCFLYMHFSDLAAYKVEFSGFVSEISTAQINTASAAAS